MKYFNSNLKDSNEQWKKVSSVVSLLLWPIIKWCFGFASLTHPKSPLFVSYNRTRNRSIFFFFYNLPHNFRNVCVAGKSFIPNSESMWKLPQVLNFLLFLDIAWVYSNWLFSICLNFVYFVDFVVFDWWVIPVFAACLLVGF